MIELIQLLLQSVADLIKANRAADKEAERQALLRMSRLAMEEVAKRDLN